MTAPVGSYISNFKAKALRLTASFQEPWYVERRIHAFQYEFVAWRLGYCEGAVLKQGNLAHIQKLMHEVLEPRISELVKYSVRVTQQESAPLSVLGPLVRAV